MPLADNTINSFPLSRLPIGRTAVVSELLSSDSLRRRMLDIGIIRGTHIKALRRSPSGDPIAYFIRGSVIALRDTDAEKILVSYAQ